jgi:2-polyprenyl-3-methyl-5-hydroxy-6-metoxy-1,4-benzoquinol methylase
LIVHLKDPKIFFREVYRVLKPGGVFILSNINQKKAPKLRLNSKEEIVIKSFYHRPQDVISGLEEEFFVVEKEDFVEEDSIWINQIIVAKK